MGTTLTYMYRLAVRIPPGRYLDVPTGHDGSIDVTDGGQTAHLTVPTDDEDTEVVLTGHGFHTADAARSAGELGRSAIRTAALVADVPVDAFKSDDDVEVRTESGGLVGVTARGRGRVSMPVDKFVDPLRDALAGHRQLTKKEALAVDLYLAATFEHSIRSRFVTLVTALEALSDRASRPPAVVEHLQALKMRTRQAMKAAGDQDDRAAFERLHSALADLEEDSIGLAIRGVVKSHVADDAVFDSMARDDFVKHCYSVRSKLVHDGEEPEGVRLMERHDQLRRLVRTVLLSVAAHPSL